MQQPTDYPIEKDGEHALDTETDGSSLQLADDITYAALLDRAASEQEITDEMIQAACQKMEAAQQFPFSESPEGQVGYLSKVLRLKLPGTRN